MISFRAVAHVWEILSDIKVQTEENILLLLGDCGKATCDSHESYVNVMLLQTAAPPHKLTENKGA